MIKRITHAAVWRVNPREGNVFVSDYLKSILPSLKRNSQIKKILDVACGNGMGVTIPLLRIGYDLWCFDHVQSAINAIKQNAVVEGFNVHAKKADMYKKYPYKDNTFDATFCVYETSVCLTFRTFTVLNHFTIFNPSHQIFLDLE